MNAPQLPLPPSLASLLVQVVQPRREEQTLAVTRNADGTFTVSMWGQAFSGATLHDALDVLFQRRALVAPPAWMHVSGKGPYRVVCVADAAPDADEEPTVVYQGPDGAFWTRKLSNFYARMTQVPRG